MTPQETKYIKIGIGVVAVGIVGYLLFSGKDNGGGGTDPTGNNGSVTPTFNANNVRLTLFDAMNQAGTDEDTIIETLRTISQSQFKQVVDAFGLERYSDWLGYKTSFGTPRNLQYWLKAELSSDEYANLKRKYPNFLY